MGCLTHAMQEANVTLIVVEVIATAGIVAAAFFANRYRQSRKDGADKDRQLDEAGHAYRQVENELTFQNAALGFNEFVGEWQSIIEQLNDLMENTAIDRFLILRAWNGRLDPKWTTAFYQYRQGDQDPVPYIHFQLDKDYQERLRQIIGNKFLYFEVADIQDSFIKSVYQAEGVTASFWVHLGSFTADDKDQAMEGSKAVIYCSFATHGAEGIPDADRTRAMILAARLQGVVAEYHRGHRMGMVDG